jgi:hypothetical protein
MPTKEDINIQLNEINDNSMENTFAIKGNTDKIAETISQYEESIANDKILNELQILPSKSITLKNPIDISGIPDININKNRIKINSIGITEYQFRNLQRSYVSCTSSTDLSSIATEVPLSNQIRPSSITKHIGIYVVSIHLTSLSI